MLFVMCSKPVFKMNITAVYTSCYCMLYVHHTHVLKDMYTRVCISYAYVVATSLIAIYIPHGLFFRNEWFPVVFTRSIRVCIH